MSMWIILGFVVALCVVFVLGAVFGRKMIRKSFSTMIAFSNDAEEALKKIKESL